MLKLYYSAKLTNSTNKPKTTWNIIKAITYNQKRSNSMPVMEIEGKLTTHRQTIAEKFNIYYISVADNITNNNQTKTLLIIQTKRPIKLPILCIPTVLYKY